MHEREGERAVRVQPVVSSTREGSRKAKRTMKVANDQDELYSQTESAQPEGTQDPAGHATATRPPFAAADQAPATRFTRNKQRRQSPTKRQARSQSRADS